MMNQWILIKYIINQKMIPKNIRKELIFNIILASIKRNIFKKKN